MDQALSMMMSRLRAIYVDLYSLAATSGAAEVWIKHEKNGPIASIYPQITRIFTDETEY